MKMLHLRSVGTRMVLSHILVATLTTIIVWLVFLLLVTLFSTKPTPGDYVNLVALETGFWMAGAPDGQPNPPTLSYGSALVVSPDNQVLHSFGDTGCRAGARLADCASNLAGSLPGERQLTINNEEWAQLVVPLRTGERTIIMYKIAKPELAINIPILGLITGNGPYVLTISLITSVLSIPVALLLAWLLVQPLLRRIKKVTSASQQFARGELETRVKDHYPDEIGELAHQFDEMADVLKQNVVVLRELAQRNAELAQVAETAAIQAERVRLSRDLHDDITQRVFSLSVSSASLPAIIELDPARATEQARQISTMAEQTLLVLRAFLVDLRPTQLVQRGLAEALQTMCDEWGKAQKIPIECSVVLNGTRLPSSVENEIYRVTQESLNNTAKHARASSVQVSLVQGKRQIVLSTTDDGQGFDRSKPGVETKFGLISMRERAQAIGGNLIIESDTTRGTTVRMILPFERDEFL